MLFELFKNIISTYTECFPKNSFSMRLAFQTLLGRNRRAILLLYRLKKLHCMLYNRKYKISL